MSAAFEVEKTRGVFTYPYEFFGAFLRANQGSPDAALEALMTQLKARWKRKRKLKKVGKRGAGA